MKVWLFRLIMLAIPVLFFAALEGLLRAFDYGDDYPLFIDNPANSHYVLPRPDIVSRYFAAGSALPAVTMEANFLRKDKPESGYRLFVQGGSTAAGYPYGLGASIAGMLDQRVRQSLPERYVEVVNTAMSAVNSYTLLDLADEIIEQQPDAVLIYAGHNEYLGLLGVGSNFTVTGSSATTLLFLKLRELRLFQAMQQLYQGMGEPPPAAKQKQGKTSRTFMAKVAKNKDIPYQSDVFEAGLKQFETNLSLLLDKYERAGVPVYLATIASNLKDQPPFSSPQIDNDAASQFKQWRQRLSSAEQAVVGEISDYADELGTSNNANSHYQFAHLAAKAGLAKLALAHFTRARDLDLLRFRAPSGINEIIRQQAKRDGVYLVDAEAALAQRSPSGIIGNNFMLEHLHPNVQGYFVIADSFYQSLQQHNGQAGWQAVDTATAWRNRPLLPAEEYHGFAQVLKLKADYPFTDTPEEVRLPKPADWQQQLGQMHYLKQIDWLTMIQRSLAGYRKQNDRAMVDKTTQILADALPHVEQINRQAAISLRRQGRSKEAHYYTERAKLASQ